MKELIELIGELSEEEQKQWADMIRLHIEMKRKKKIAVNQ